MARSGNTACSSAARRCTWGSCLGSQCRAEGLSRSCNTGLRRHAGRDAAGGGRSHRWEDAAEWLGPVFAVAFGIAVRIHVPRLFVLTITVHGKSCSVTSGTKERFFEKPALKIPIDPHAAARHSRRWRFAWVTGGFCGNAEAPDTNRSAARQCFKYICTTDRSQLHTLSHYHWIGPERLPSGPALLARPAAHPHPTELHFSRLVQGRVMGSSKWLGLTRSAYPRRPVRSGTMSWQIRQPSPAAPPRAAPAPRSLPGGHCYPRARSRPHANVVGCKPARSMAARTGTGLPLVTEPAGPGPASTNFTRSQTSRTREFQRALSRTRL